MCIFDQLHDLNKTSSRWSDAVVAAPVLFRVFAVPTPTDKTRSRTCRSSNAAFTVLSSRSLLGFVSGTRSLNFPSRNPKFNFQERASCTKSPICFLRLGSRSKAGKKMLLLAGSFNVIFPPPLVMIINTQCFFHTSVLKAV